MEEVDAEGRIKAFEDNLRATIEELGMEADLSDPKVFSAYVSAIAALREAGGDPDAVLSEFAEGAMDARPGTIGAAIHEIGSEAWLRHLQAQHLEESLALRGEKDPRGIPDDVRELLRMEDVGGQLDALGVSRPPLSADQRRRLGEWQSGQIAETSRSPSGPQDKLISAKYAEGTDVQAAKALAKDLAALDDERLASLFDGSPGLKRLYEDTLSQVLAQVRGADPSLPGVQVRSRQGRGRLERSPRRPRRGPDEGAARRGGSD